MQLSYSNEAMHKTSGDEEEQGKEICPTTPILRVSPLFSQEAFIDETAQIQNYRMIHPVLW